jgi:hypothetical protein
VVDWRHYPGPPMRSAWERQCAGPLCLPARALSSASGGSRWGRCGSRRTGSTTVSVVRFRCGSVNAAITATCTAPASARGSGAASRKGAVKRGISGAAAVRGAARQRRWRERQRQKQKIVTHQGSPVTVTQCIVAVSPVMQSQPDDASPDEPDQGPKIHPRLDRCAFCGATLPDWTRQRPWRWSG